MWAELRFNFAGYQHSICVWRQITREQNAIRISQVIKQFDNGRQKSKTLQTSVATLPWAGFTLQLGLDHAAVCACVECVYHS